MSARLIKQRVNTKHCANNYYRFIVRFPIGLEFLFITFTILLHLLLSWTSSLSISSLAISTSTLSNHVFLGLKTGLLPSTLYLIHFFTQCCCLPTPMTLASGGSPMFPLVVHQPASPSIWPAVQSLRRGLSRNPGRQCGAYVGAVEEMMCVVCVDVTEGA